MKTTKPSILSPLFKITKERAQILLSKMRRLNFQKKKFANLSAFLLLLLIGGFVWRTIPGKEATRDLSLYTIVAKEGKLPSTINASGELQAQKSLNVNPQLQGLILEIYVEEGDKVLKDQLIAKIDSRDYLFRLKELEVEFTNKKSIFERRKTLYEQGGISAESYDEYKKSYLMSKARLEQRKVEGKEFSIKAPFAGVITARYAEPGSFVSPNSQTRTNETTARNAVVELSQGLEVIAKVPESEIGRIEIGQEANVRVEAFPDERFKAKVIDIAPRAIKSNNVTSFEVKLFFTNAPSKLRIGMTSDIEFQAGKTGLKTLVPTVSIVTEGGEPGVLIVGKKDQPLFKKVELGISSGSKTAIIKGVNPGDQIFIDLPPWANRKRN